MLPKETLHRVLLRLFWFCGERLWTPMHRLFIKAFSSQVAFSGMSKSSGMKDLQQRRKWILFIKNLWRTKSEWISSELLFCEAAGKLCDLSTGKWKADFQTDLRGIRKVTSLLLYQKTHRSFIVTKIGLIKSSDIKVHFREVCGLWVSSFFGESIFLK